MIHGGRLYDKWWLDTELPKPTTSHPSYPSIGKKRGAATWRCKECHGWDYRGKYGAYGKGSHYTGIKGIRSKAGEDINTIVAILKDRRHRYNKLLKPGDLKALALFVNRGQVDMRRYISRHSNKVKGDVSNGKTIYFSYCLSCHGPKGQNLNLAHNRIFTEYVGDVAYDNPWETLHKIRFGHPGAYQTRMRLQSGMRDYHMGRTGMWVHMPPMYGVITFKQQINLLSYTQSLPRYKK